MVNRNLFTLRQKIFDLMKDGEWRSLGDIEEAIGCGSATGISAKLRDLRKQECGGHTVESGMFGPIAHWEYRLIPRPAAAAALPDPKATASTTENLFHTDLSKGSWFK